MAVVASEQPGAEFRSCEAESEDMPQFILQVSNGAPVRFNGELLAEAGVPESEPGPYARWHEVRIYRSDSGKYILQICFRSNAMNSDGDAIEPSQDEVFVCESGQSLLDEATGYEPNRFVVGYPKGISQWEMKQRRLRKNVSMQYDSAIGIALAKAAEKDPSLAQDV